MKSIVAATVLLIVGAACGSSQPAPSGATSPSPSPAGPPLVAVLQAGGMRDAKTYDTVAIAGLDGVVRAHATFAPMPLPDAGCMGTVLPPSAHVAAGKVYFADANGVVRSLAIDGTVSTVATFPMTSAQQMLSFAVSPDGGKLLGTVYTIPMKVFACNGSEPTGTFAFDAYSASAGGSRTLLYHEAWTKPQDVLALTGWDAVGPIGTYPTVWASQGGGPASTLGVYVRVDAATLKPGGRLADPAECQVWSSIHTGAFACLKNPVAQGSNYVSTGSVRRLDGTEAWTFSFVAMNAGFGAQLAPDGHRVISCCLDVPSGFAVEVFTDGAPAKSLANGFTAEGWLDSTTVIGEYHPDPTSQPPADLAYVALSAPETAVSMGFKGLFVGTVRG